ncbi:hypothetical protein B0T13DRAFT_473429 [Neurospora crassa]|nr:hypothetical protein B0T13DRAFT_473429 [Neurospora crassa]
MGMWAMGRLMPWGGWGYHELFERNTSSSLCLCQMTQLLGACVVRGTLHTIGGHLPEKRTVCDESETNKRHRETVG